jgi:NAD(P)-dependent dehydrogenase (short-subunit alcohol dehydrogenase family)
LRSDSETALITGGTGAIGQAVVRRFLEDGFRVAVTYRSEPEWQTLAESEKRATAAGALFGVRADVIQEDSMAEAVRRAAEELGALRVLLHVAGGYTGGVPVEKIPAETVRRMIGLNLESAFWAAKHVIPHAKRSGRGRLLFVSSRGATEVGPGAAAYAAAKAGLNALVQTLAKELRQSGTTANAILPSIVDTAANRATMPGADHATWVQPAEVASLLSFLASDGASATSGALIPIYGRA